MEWTRFTQPLRTNTRLRAAALLGVLLAAGVLFSLANVSFVRAATASITVASINSPVPAGDPFSPLWQQSAPADVPLSAQQMWQPGGGSVAAVQVRALEDGQNIAFLVSWADATRNDYVKDMPSDAAAIQLPTDPASLPYQCMGQSTNLVNIWQWKAAIEKTAHASGQPYNGTRNLTSNGMGKAVETRGVPPTATSTWRDGHWYVIYARNLAPAGPGTAPLMVGENTNAAFAIWDGAKGETRSMKAVSTWTPVELPGAATNEAMNLVSLAILALVAVGAVVLAWRIIPH
jgi:DMSO reductase family type II enzyme heme b subunit